MKNLNRNYYNPFFSHIYVEHEVMEHPRARRILDRFAGAQIIEISHYKDVFCRKGQNAALQHRSQKLIVAKKQGSLLYRGALPCQSFGNEHFYYTSCVMNCMYHCEYCYLKGMYPSGNIVIFVNLEDYFCEARRMLARHPVYLCISYDTDLLAFEHMTGYVAEWLKFAKDQENLTMEIRTKCANRGLWSRMPAIQGVIYAFTLSPQAVIDAFEYGTPSLEQRIACVAEAMQHGLAVRLCFDPMLYCPDWELHYGVMLEQIFAQIPIERLADVSVGTFRISQDYLKKMRRQEPYSAIVQFPYQNDGGICRYPKALSGRMEKYLTDRLKTYLPAEKIFVWEQEDS